MQEYAEKIIPGMHYLQEICNTRLKYVYFQTGRSSQLPRPAVRAAIRPDTIISVNALPPRRLPP